ncbi:MAG: TRAP transporter substrate-binding protein [Melioribacteraceae bacterium]|nr:TRAP transporter substrate-binding protein [Melioribacteraceae bacterium]
MKKNVFRIFTFISLIVLVLGCSAKSDKRVLKLAHGLDPSHPVHKSMEFMAQRLKEKSNGTLEIQIYPSQQLGNERQLVELLQIGSLAMTKVAASVMENFSPLYTVFGLPYIFNDDKHKFAVWDSEIGERILTSSEKYLLRGLCYYDAGNRSFYTIKSQVNSPADLTGLKIRVMESQTAMKLVRSLTGSPTPISWGELYTALQQGVVDGAENNPPSFYLSRHYEVCKYYSLDEHTAVPDVLLIGTKIWKTLNKDQQKWLQEAVKESTVYQRKIWQEASDHAIEEVKKAGVQVIRPDKTPFINMVQPVYEEYKDKPEIYNLLKEIKEFKNDSEN